MTASQPGDLRAAIEALEGTTKRLEALGTDRSRMTEIIEMRQSLAGGFGAINALLDTYPLSAETKEEARRRLTALRHLVSLHQAHWPIIAARDDIDGYQASAARVSNESREFIDWMRQLPQQNMTGHDDYRHA